MTASQTYDVIVIGAGHNGLICAAYLAKAGLRTLVLEKADVLGGCSITKTFETPAGKFKHTIGGIDHINILAGPYLRDLELERFGLRYLFHDPLWFFPFNDGKSLIVYRDIERTCEQISSNFSPKDAKAYKGFCEFWNALGEILGPLDLSEPVGLADIALMLENVGMEDLLQSLLTSPKVFAQEWFESPELQAVVCWFGVQAGTSPSSPGSALASSLLSVTHSTGMARPEGGSGSLPDSAARMIEAYGGAVIPRSEVKEILVENGRAIGVMTIGGHKFAARRAVVSAIDAKRVFTRLVNSDLLDQRFLRRVRRIRTGNVSLVNTVYALKERPRFERYADNIELASSTQMICPSVSYLERAWSEIQKGEPSKEPALWCAIPSALDPTLAPTGMHTLWLSEFTPAIPNGTTWDELREETGAKQIKTYSMYAPNAKSIAIASITDTPLDRERRTGNIGGNPYQIDMTIDQMLSFRPTPELSHYRTPIIGLYLTGSATHPGGGITGAPGHNSAMTVLTDLGIARRRRNPLRKLSSAYRAVKTLKRAMRSLEAIS